MFKHKKRIAAVLLAACMLASAFAGCSSETSTESSSAAGSSTAGSTSSTSSGEPADLSAQTIEWSFFGNYAVGTDDPQDAYVLQRIQEEFNVKIDYSYQANDSAQYMQQLNLLISSGDVPDVFLPMTYQQFALFARQGVLAEVPKEMLYENAPNMMAYVDKTDEDAWIFSQVDGVNYAVPVVWPLGDHSRVNVIREDWLDAVGLEIPTNIEEFEAVLDAFRNGDPDGNGQKDTYPIGCYLTSTAPNYVNIFPGLFGMFGSHPNQFMLDDSGNVTYGAIQPETKTALETLNRWYEAEYIDPEFYVDTQDTWLEKWVQGKLGYIASSYWWTSGPADKYFSGTWYDPVVDANPNAKITNFAPMTGPNGDSGVAQLPVEEVLPVIAFSKALEETPEVMERYLQVQDTLQSDPYWAVLIYDGEEGDTYTRNEDGSITYTEKFDTFDKRTAYGANGAFSQAPNYDVYDAETKDMSYVESQRALAIGPIDILKDYPLEAHTQYKVNLDALASKAMIDFITGARPIEEFDAFVQEWLSSGGQATLDEAQQVYEERFKE